MLLAYHNDPVVKAAAINNVNIDAALSVHFGQVVLGTNDFDEFPARIGIPVWLAKTAACIYGELDADVARKFPKQFLQAIQVGTMLNAELRLEFCMRRIRYLDALSHSESDPSSQRLHSFVKKVVHWHQLHDPIVGLRLYYKGLTLVNRHSALIDLATYTVSKFETDQIGACVMTRQLAKFAASCLAKQDAERDYIRWEAETLLTTIKSFQAQSLDRAFVVL